MIRRHQTGTSPPDGRRGVRRAALVLGVILASGQAGLGQQVRSKSSDPPPSEFLQPPGAGSTSEGTAGAGLPAWWQASFFGIQARGRVFVFVVDCSGSMADAARLVRAKSELRRCIQALRWPLRFHVIFYNDRPWPQPGGVPRAADQDSKSRLFRWLQTVDADGETDPRAALSMALGLKPDAVFLLSDGLFPEGTVPAVAGMNPNRIPIHCVDLAGGAAGDDLRAIAEGSGGRYEARP